MSKPLSLMPGTNTAGTFTVSSPRAGDVIGGALRSVFDQCGTPDDMLALLKCLDQVEAIPARN